MSWKHEKIIVADVETTGLKVGPTRIIELGLLVVENLEVIHEFETLLHPRELISPKITEITGIQNQMLADQPFFEHIAADIKNLFESVSCLCFYNGIKFDVPHIRSEFSRCSVEFSDVPVIDPLIWVRHFDKYMKGKKLTDVAAKYSIKVAGTAHRALVDCYLLAGVMRHYVPKLPDDLYELLHLQEMWQRQQQEDFRKYRNRKK